jgi:HEAT repeat protein
VEAQEDPDEGVRKTARQALQIAILFQGKLDPESRVRFKAEIMTIVEQLESPSPVERYRAAIILGQEGTDAEAAVPQLLARLKDEHAFVRRAAGEALEAIAPAKYANGELEKVRGPE